MPTPLQYLPLSLEVVGVGEKWVGYVAGQASWSFAEPVLTLRSRAVSTMTLRNPGELPEGAGAIAENVQVRFRVYPDYTGLSGSGTIVFQGRLTRRAGSADPSRPGARYTFSDPWYDLTYTTFMHHWNTYDPTGTTHTQTYQSRINLFEEIFSDPTEPYNYITTQAQLLEVIQYAQTQCGLNLQPGTIDPTWNQPIYAAKAIHCADAITICLRPCPDAVTYFDYSVIPPKLHVRQRVNLVPVTMPYRTGFVPGGVTHKSSEITARPDVQASEIVLQYQKTNKVNQTTYVSWATDAFPPGSSGTALGSMVAPIDLIGSSSTVLVATVTSKAVDPTTVAYWQGTSGHGYADAKKPDLAQKDSAGNLLIPTAGITVSNVKVLLQDGTDITATFAANWPNELQPGPGVAPWMYSGATAIVSKDCTITATLNYKKIIGQDSFGGSGTNTNTGQQVDNHVVSVRATLTNSAAGAQTYSATASNDPGEAVPFGLAEAIYNASGAQVVIGGNTYGQATPYEGQHVVLEQAPSGVPGASPWKAVGPGNTLNLTGGLAAWASFNAQVFESEVDFQRGRTTVSFGPHKYLTPQEWWEILAYYRVRFLYQNPLTRQSGVDQGAQGSSLPTDNAKENTNAGLPSGSTATAAIGATPDSATQVGLVQHVGLQTGGVADCKTVWQAQDENGNLITPASGVPNGLVTVQLSKCLGSDSNFHAVSIQECIVTDPATNTVKRALLLCTGPFASSSGSPVLNLAGGGSGTMYWAGVYSGSTAYNPGAVVRVTSGTSQGTYVWSGGSPVTGTAPTYPETTSWKLLALPVQSTTMCVSGSSTTVYVNASSGF